MKHYLVFTLLFYICVTLAIAYNPSRHQEALKVLEERARISFVSNSHPDKPSLIKTFGSHRLSKGTLMNHEESQDKSSFQHFGLRYNVALKYNVVRPELMDVVKDFVCSEDGVYLRVDASDGSFDNTSSILEPNVFPDDVLLADNSFWNCALPSYKENKNLENHISAESSKNVLYRKLLGTPMVLSSENESEQVVFYETSVLSFTDLLSHGSIRLSHTPRLHELSDSQPPVVGYSKEISLFNFNYDPSANAAKDKNMTIPVPGSLGVICEDCYAYIKAGFEMELDIDLFQGIKNFKTRVYGDTELRLKYTAKLIKETKLKHKILERNFGSLTFMIGFIPVSISFSGQLDLQLETTGILSVRDNFSLKGNAQLGAQYTNQWGEFRDISSISYPHHLPLKPVFEIDDRVTIQITLIPVVKTTFEHCLPLDLALKPSLKIDIEPEGDQCEGASYSTSWLLDTDVSLEKLHFMKWSVGAGVLPAHTSISLVSERPLNCPFCSGCVNTMPILFAFDPNQSILKYSSTRVHITQLHRECGRTDNKEWLEIGSQTTGSAYCSNGGYLQQSWKTFYQSTTNFYTMNMWNERTAGSIFNRHLVSSLEESWNVYMHPYSFNWDKSGETGSGAHDRYFNIISTWYPMIELNDRYSEYKTSARFTAPYNQRPISHYEVHMNVSENALISYTTETNNWSSDYSDELKAGNTYIYKSPISFYFNISASSRMIAIPVYSLEPNKPLQFDTIQLNGVVKVNTSSLATLFSNIGSVVLDIKCKVGEPIISVAYGSSLFSTINNKTIELDKTTIDIHGWPTVQIRAPSNNQLMGLTVTSAFTTHVPAEKTISVSNTQVSVAVNATAEEVFVDTYATYFAQFAERLTVVDSDKNPSPNLFAMADYVENPSDAASFKLLLLKFDSKQTLANVHFIHRMFTGEPRISTIPSSSSKIFSYHVPNSEMVTKFYFQTQDNVKIRFFDGSKGLQGSRQFTDFRNTDISVNMKTFEISNRHIESKKLYIEIFSSSNEAQVKLLFVEVENIDAREQQIKEINIGAAGYRVFNISIPSSFKQGLFLKCEPHGDSDPDLLASAQDLSTVDTTSKVSIMKTRLGKDQLGLSVEDSQGALEQGFFFLAVYSYNATKFMFDINALDAPRGDIKAAVGVEKDLGSISVSDVRQGKATLQLKLGGQFQFADSLYYDKNTKSALAKSIKSTVDSPSGWNAMVSPRLSEIDEKHIVMDKEQQLITVQIPKVPHFDPDSDEDLVLDTERVLTPSFKSIFTGLTVQRSGPDPHNSDASDHSHSQSQSQSEESQSQSQQSSSSTSCQDFKLSNTRFMFVLLCMILWCIA